MRWCSYSVHVAADGDRVYSDDLGVVRICAACLVMVWAEVERAILVERLRAYFGDRA